MRQSPSIIMGKRQHGDGDSELFINSQRTLSVMFQIFLGVWHLHATVVLGESKIVSVIASH